MGNYTDEAIDMLRDITIARIRLKKDIDHIESYKNSNLDEKVLDRLRTTYNGFGNLRDIILENIMSAN